MGISERSYYRSNTTPRRGGSWFRGMAVTGWIIVACAVVFVFNEFSSRTVPLPGPVILQQNVDPQQLQGIAPAEFKRVPATVQWGVETRQGFVPNERGPIGRQAIVLGNNPIGVQEFRRVTPFVRWGCFSTATAVLWHDMITGWGGFQVWRFITFQFLHADINHILFNMLTLYFFGGMVEQYLGRKRYLAFYLLCGICGALMYLLLNGLGYAVQTMLGPQAVIPGLLFNDPTMPLIGASAGVFGVIMAGAYLAPNATVLLFFLIPMRLKTLAYGLVCVALAAVFFGWTNAGGEAAHIGGAIAGFYFIRNPHHLHGMFDFLGRYDPSSRTNRARLAARQAEAHTAEINRILDKIRTQGLASLTDQEKRLLREASRR